DQAVFQKVLRLDLTEDFAGLAVLWRQDLGAKADRGRPPARRDDLLEPIEGAATHEQDVSRLDLQEFVGTVTGPPSGRPSQGWSLSARASSVGGISRPSARAVGKLMTQSSFVDCTTGRSEGFSPFRTRPT